jgi:hypothetical protein
MLATELATGLAIKLAAIKHKKHLYYALLVKALGTSTE